MVASRTPDPRSGEVLSGGEPIGFRVVDTDLDTGVERKVRRVDREVHGIYAMLVDISATQRRHGDTLAKHGVTLSETLGRLLEQRLQVHRIEGDLARLDDKVRHLSAAQRRQDERLDELDEKLDSIIDLVRDDH